MYLKKVDLFLVKRGIYLQLTALILLFSFVILCSTKTGTVPIRTVIELDTGETQEVVLYNGEKVNVTLIDITEKRDNVRNAVRSVNVTVEINGERVTIPSARYNLPVMVGSVQIDCPITKISYTNSHVDSWGLAKDARFRFWPAGSPYIKPGTFVYPVKQRLFADDTQMSNEPTYVDWGEPPLLKKIYYHNALDFGGFEGKVEVLSATDGLVISSAGETMPEYKDAPIKPYYDAIYVIDKRGWILRYVHLFSINPDIRPGVQVKKGQHIALLGKEGTSGGFAHLHFEIKCQQPSGKWGTEEGFAYIREAYVREHKPAVVALARPHYLIWDGESVRLDGSKSKSFTGSTLSYEWIFSDGSHASGAVQNREYTVPGTYSEILKATDSKGNIDYDYVVVQVRNRVHPEKMPPSIHAVYHPSLDIKPGMPVTFGVRTFRSEVGNEVWDFGDGSPSVKVKSIIPKHPDGPKGKYAEFGYHPLMGKYAETVHTYEKPGHYLVRVERENEHGYKAIAHLHVEVE